MNARKLFSLFLLLVLIGTSELFALTPIPDSAEDLFWQPPATIHNLKNRCDLHNWAASVIALTELEFLRLGDHGVSFLLGTKKQPFEKTADHISNSYQKLPQVFIIRRFGQLMDGLQIRQFSLSDARFAATVAGGGIAGLTPIMQTRISKLIIFGEDIIYDADFWVMLPLDVAVTEIKGKKIHIKSVAYAADTVEFLRQRIFSGLRVVNRIVVRTGSRLIKEVEKPLSKIVRVKRSRANKHFPIYVQMDYLVYEQNRKFFEKAKHLKIASLEDWKLALNGDKLPADLRFRKTPKFGPLQEGLAQSTVVMIIEYTDWKKAPKRLRRYVIDRDEFWNLVSDNYAPSLS